MKNIIDVFMSHQILLMGILFFVLGIILVVFSRLHVRKTIFASIEPREMKVLGKGNPNQIDSFSPFPCPTILEVKFQAPRGHKAIFRLIRKTTIEYISAKTFDSHEITYLQQVCGTKKIKFPLYPDPGNVQYILKVEGNREGISQYGFEKISDILKWSKCVDIVNHSILLEKNNGQHKIKLQRFVAMLEPILCSGWRGEKLRDKLITELPNYKKYFLTWYSRCPDIFDKIADVVKSTSQCKDFFVGIVQYQLYKEDRPYQWLLHVGLTFIIISSSLFLLIVPCNIH